MDEARQAVWNLRGQESLDFAETLKRMAERLDRSSTIDIACTVEGDAYDFNATAIHEITMASREAIFNAILHANPANISVRATFGADVFTLTVVDDGSGFETSPDPNEGHFGLKGIQERIKRLGGSVDLVSAIDRGTRISIRVPRAAVCAPAPTAHAGNALQEAIR
jgi:signal transduction histidine kinase